MNIPGCEDFKTRFTSEDTMFLIAVFKKRTLLGESPKAYRFF